MTKRVVVGVVTKQCEQCGADVTRKNSLFRKHVFCTRECYWKSDHHRSTVAASNARMYPDRRADRPCLNCGQVVNRAISEFNPRVFCSVPCKRALAISAPTRKINSNGYVMVWVGLGAPGSDKSGNMLEHRKIMQESLGRPLLPEENVHHRNGVRTDNRIENLELWSRSQPSGQRVEDKILWAREFLAQYDGLPIAP